MKPTNAPACFAAASVFTHDSEVCRKCCAFDACAAASLETLERIRHVVNVADLLKRHEKAKKVSREAIKAADQQKAAEQPPGNNQPPLPGAVERKTNVASVSFDLTAQEKAVVMTLTNSKAQEFVVRLLKRGAMVDIKQSVKEKRNTVSESEPPWLRIAIDRLISGGFTRTELRSTYAEKLNWQDKTAGPHASMAVLIFKGFGLAQEIEGRLVPAPAYA
jgi:hypothetical protein